MAAISRKVATRTILRQTIVAIEKMIVLVVRNVLRDRPGEEAMRFFLSFFTDENLVPMQSAWTEGTKKVVFLAESVSENNTLTFKTDRVLNIVVGDSVGKEYDRNFTTTAFFKAQITVNASGQLTAIYLTLHADDTPHLVADEGSVDLSTLSHAYGTFPSHLFTVNERPAPQISEEENTTSVMPESKTEPVKASSDTKEDIHIEITIGSSMALVNDKQKFLDSPAFIENDRTYLPLRFVTENLGVKDIIWDESVYSITIVA